MKMQHDKVSINGIEIDVWSLNTVVVGTGAAGLNAADHIYNFGQEDLAIVTEGVNMGTSRNTGSDKQTYYKLTMAGETGDSVAEMANTLFSGGARHGDVALVEAALSARAFNKLVEIGVDFPHNRYGEYVGYKTDHDPRQRATSIGPYTSRVMTEKLERQVRLKGIRIFDNCLVIGILTADGPTAVGLVALDMSRLDEPGMGITLFNCTNIVYATGGPAGMYAASVYPESQTGALGIAFEAGVAGVNLTESQYGIAATKFRWNLSGSYQQVIPCYISTDRDGNNTSEFLAPYFPDAGKMLSAIFLKGYEWPFDARKIGNYGSSLIDLLVYHEINDKGRRVFLDYRRNPACSLRDGQFDFSLLSAEAYDYLARSGALFGTPIERLRKMNLPAAELFSGNGIDLAAEPLEIAVCAQHSNGGLQGDVWWESNVAHFFPIGEANGSFGVYRPGGSALNAAQVGGIRAAEYISRRCGQGPLAVAEFLRAAGTQVEAKLSAASLLAGSVGAAATLKDGIRRLQAGMTGAGAVVRSLPEVDAALSRCREELVAFPRATALASRYDLPDAFRYYDMLVTQFMYLSSIREYIMQGGQSRGSYIVSCPQGFLPAAGLPDKYRYRPDAEGLMNMICEVRLGGGRERSCSFAWIPVRPVPREDGWFEMLWAEYREGKIWKKG